MTDEEKVVEEGTETPTPSEGNEAEASESSEETGESTEEGTEE